MALHPEILEVQAGKETTWGTPVTPTVKLMGIEECTMEPVVDSTLHEEYRGSYLPGYLTDLSHIGAKGKVAGKLTYQDSPYLASALFSDITPTGSNPYTYAGPAPTTTVPAPRKQTIVKGNGTDTYKVEGALPTDLEITFKANEPFRYAYNFLGKKYSTGTLAGLSDRSVDVVMGDQVALWIDALGGTIGTTAISTAFFEGSLKIQPKRTTYPSMGSLTDSGFVDGKFMGTLGLTLLFDTTTKAYLDAVLAGSSVISKLVRIRATKSAATFTIDFAGTQLKAIQPFDVANDVVCVKLELTGIYDSGAFANWCKLTSVNAVSALP